MPRKKKSSKTTINLTVPSIVVAIVAFLAYELIQQTAFPIVVHEQDQIQLQACFTPSRKCQNKLISFIDKAEHEILMMCYSFTAEPIAQALLNARKRGVNVQVIADKSQTTAPYSQIPMLKSRNIPVFIDHNVAIAHNKVLVIDNTTTVSGSYNFSAAAEHRNAENLVFIESKELAKQYKLNWLTRRDESIPLSTNNVDISVQNIPNGNLTERIH